MKKLDLVIVTITPLVIFALIFLFHLDITYLESLLLFFGIPCLYLSIKNISKVKGIVLFTVIVGFPIAVIFQLISYGNNAWYVPNSILPYRLFGVTPLEDFLWMFLTLYTVIIFYEHFCNNSIIERKMNKNMRYMSIFLYIMTAIVALLHIFIPSFLVIPYAYLWLGIIFFVIPTPIFFIKYPSFLDGAFKTALYFFCLHLLVELIGVKLHHWTFPGTTYLGWISFGNIAFPLEEFFFVMVIGGFVGIAYYEFLTNKDMSIFS